MTAIFLIVVLAGLGLAVMNLSNVEHDTTSKSLLSAKVYYGAKAGIDWGIQQAVSTTASCVDADTAVATGGNLSEVSVTVRCKSSPQGAATSVVYYITSKATTGSLGSFGYAERRMEATVSNIP